jgi:hypothetical protein
LQELSQVELLAHDIKTAAVILHEASATMLLRLQLLPVPMVSFHSTSLMKLQSLITFVPLDASFDFALLQPMEILYTAQQQPLLLLQPQDHPLSPAHPPHHNTTPAHPASRFERIIHSSWRIAHDGHACLLKFKLMLTFAPGTRQSLPMLLDSPLWILSLTLPMVVSVVLVSSTLRENFSYEQNTGLMHGE